MRGTTKSVRTTIGLLAGAVAWLCGSSALPAQEPDVQPADRMAAEADASLAENEPDDPMAAGRSLYFDGGGQLRRGDKLARKAAKAKGDERAELEAEAREAYEAAAQSLTQAVQAAPGLLDAYVGLGAALRALGRADQALQVHALALQRDESSDENFRGYVASLLALERLGNAALLYDQVKVEKPKRAKIVYEELASFYEERRKEPGNLAPADLDRLAGWLAEHRSG